MAAAIGGKGGDHAVVEIIPTKTTKDTKRILRCLPFVVFVGIICPALSSFASPTAFSGASIF